MGYTDFVKTLEKNICNVKFTKVNGEYRNMDCTLKEEFLPENTKKKTSPETKKHISVWDINRDAWRAFRIDNVQQFTIKG